MHGFLGSHSDWSNYIEYFSKNYNCIAIDLPGHGKSQIYELEDLINFIPKKSHLVGYSMGGRIALQLLCSYPNHFGKAIILSANLGLKTSKEKKVRHLEEELLINKIQSQDITSFVRSWYEKPLFKNTPIPSHRFKQSPDLLIEAIRKFSLAKQQNFWNSLAEISSFTTFLYGEHDKAYKKTFDELLAKKAKAYLIKESSHAIHLQNARACINYIERSIHAN